MLKILNARAWMNALAQCWAKAPVLSFLLFFGLCAGAAWAIVPERPQSPPTASAAFAASSPARASSDALPAVIAKSSNDAELSDRIKTLEERERATYMAVLDGQRKSIDWWFSFLAIFTTLVGVGGALIPYLMGRKDKELLQSELQNARDLVASIKETKAQGEAYVDGLKTYVSGNKEQTKAETSQLRQGANKVAADPKASPIDKLYAQAVLASEVKNPTLEQANHASELWKALSLLDPSDANAAFNHAYWLQHQFSQSADASANDWQLVSAAYAQALCIKPDLHEAAYNWGVALDTEAAALSRKGDLTAAQAKWLEAGDKFAQALSIDENMHDAAHNWSASLLYEAKTLLKLNPPDDKTAQQRLSQATQLLEQHAAIGGSARKAVAYNLACAYSMQGQVSQSLAELDICRLSQNLEDDWQDDSDLANVRASPEYQTWFNLHFPKKD